MRRSESLPCPRCERLERERDILREKVDDLMRKAGEGNYSIYKVHFPRLGRSYIGMTRRTPTERLRQHKSRPQADGELHRLLHSEHHVLSVIDECHHRRDALRIERREVMKLHDPINNTYTKLPPTTCGVCLRGFGEGDCERSMNRHSSCKECVRDIQRERRRMTKAGQPPKGAYEAVKRHQRHRYNTASRENRDRSVLDPTLTNDLT